MFSCFKNNISIRPTHNNTSVFYIGLRRQPPTKNRKLTKTKTKYADNITNKTAEEKKNTKRKLYLNILHRTPDQRAI